MNDLQAKQYDEGVVSSVLVVDDNEMNRDMLVRRLNPLGYHVEIACDGRQALDMFNERNFDLVLLDIMMPVMDGFEVLNQLKASPKFKSIPVIMITALDDSATAARCINLGADDYLTKPFDPTLLKARVGACLERKRLHDYESFYRNQIERYNSELEDRVRRQVREITDAQLGAIFAMSKLAESRDPETGEHLERMREYCKVLSERLSKLAKYNSIIDDAFIADIYAASPLHDIGKVGIDDAVLLKKGKLTEKERDFIREHVRWGARILEPIAAFADILPIVLQHHEHFDGSGYPEGLAGEAIHLNARIFAVADTFDALTSHRPYREAMSTEQAIEIITKRSGSQFDPKVVRAFLDIIAEEAKGNEYTTKHVAESM